MDRNAKSAFKQRKIQIGRKVNATAAVEYFNILTSPQLLETTESLMPEYRDRVYPPTVTLSMFMRQVLEEDGSCQKAVNGWAAQRAADGLSPSSVHTGGYSKARQRLPVAMVSALARKTGSLLNAKSQAPWLWRARSVKLVDGTTISMPDTPENQASYPQPDSQAAGVGFPLARLVMVICLATGAALDMAVGPYRGKGSGELGLVRSLFKGFLRGEVMLADALYCNYFLIASMMATGVDVLFEQNGSRITDFRRGKKLGTRDHLVRWTKPVVRPEWMEPQQYAQFPDEIEVREVKVAHQVLVTTMTHHRQVSKDDLNALYARCWSVELDLRNLKTTTGMDVLTCKTPEMNEKQLWVHLLAYNLIRLLMARAASIAGIDPRDLSFKHTVQLWTEWVSHALSVRKHGGRLLILIAKCRVRKRPGRIEPRMRKRRPKAYPLLKVSREKARRKIKLHGHERELK